MGIWETSSLLTSVEPEDEVIAKSQTLAYPNPANNYVILDTDIKGTAQVNVYSMNGTLVQSFEAQGNGEIKVSTTNLKNGTYFFEVIGEDAKTVSKVLVQH